MLRTTMIMAAFHSCAVSASPGVLPSERTKLCLLYNQSICYCVLCPVITYSNHADSFKLSPPEMESSELFPCSVFDAPRPDTFTVAEPDRRMSVEVEVETAGKAIGREAASASWGESGERGGWGQAVTA